MPRSKIIYGDEVLIDLTGDTVTADTLLKGITAHDAAGNEIEGALDMTITTDTETNMTGLLKGDEGTVEAAQPGVDYATPSKGVTVTLTAAGWSDNMQTVSVSGATANNPKVISPAYASIAEYAACGIKAAAEGAGTITFACDVAPENDLIVNILIVG